MRLPTLLLLCACTPPEVHDTLPLAADLGAHAEDSWPAADQAFDWIPTVLGYGMHRLHAASGDARWQDWYRAWIDDAVADDRPPTFRSSDSMSPALLAATLMIEDPSADYTGIVALADAYLAGAPRTDEGAIEHWGAESPVAGQVWIDSQFMFGLYLLQRYRHTGDPALLDTFVTQYELFSALCRDPADQLYRHAYVDETDSNVPEEAAYWARGNAWVLVSGAELLALVGADASSAVREGFVAHATAVAGHQDPAEGLWHTVLNEPRGDDPANYVETSGSALIAYALARGVRAGVLDADEWLPVVGAAVDGVLARVELDDGVPIVEDTSYGTNPGDYDDYVGVGRADDLMLGVGAVTMLLAEVDGLEVRP